MWVELAERLVALTPFADWVVFAKNGSDVCTWAVQVARAHTRKRKVLKAEGAYHGIDAWCTPFPRGTLPEERAHVSTFRYNDTASLEAAFAESRGDVAALVLTPFRHDTGRDQELPEPGFLAAARRLCDEEDAVLVLDDIRAGFRLGLRGSGEFFGLRPDLSCVSKALANGYPLSACLGSEKLRGAAEGVFFTGSFFTSAVPMAAALACLEVLEKTDAPAHMAAMGRLLLEGLGRQAEAHGLRVRLTGPPALPFLTFPSDRGSFERSRLFCAECVRGGVYFHPYHNWFLSAAHTEEDIRRTLEVTDAAFSAVRRTFGSCPESDTGSIREGTNTRARWT
ncbi:MAG: glutamate-1-semialdehyde 2,1-aminomutase [Candidatus Binatia bacterium]|nr:MAG: glutamate-1-semialdehyde 2,1-aminomutase [Candidatus Binatia bacterium]